jgi:hypothetical protein
LASRLVPVIGGAVLSTNDVDDNWANFLSVDMTRTIAAEEIRWTAQVRGIGS